MACSFISFRKRGAAEIFRCPLQFWLGKSSRALRLRPASGAIIFSPSSLEKARKFGGLWASCLALDDDLIARGVYQ